MFFCCLSAAFGQSPNISYSIKVEYDISYLTDTNDLKSVKIDSALLLSNGKESAFLLKNKLGYDSLNINELARSKTSTDTNARFTMPDQ